jgi:hypothetical protein
MKQKIEVRTSDSNVGIIKCDSIYEAHTWVIYLEAHNIKCETVIDGVTKEFTNELQHPNTY